MKELVSVLQRLGVKFGVIWKESIVIDASIYGITSDSITLRSRGYNGSEVDIFIWETKNGVYVVVLKDHHEEFIGKDIAKSVCVKQIGNFLFEIRFNMKCEKEDIRKSLR
ncbi:hypothetical protein SBFV3_gp04 [Sulfolobales Beppu filamentous virus 3]|uniref:Uncharacterized protein n=1 Tax=Sulfolobales Beppu filamentous virus 3 TaxID=2493124 RepID=A0A3Q8Q9A2_9VIRU|nr:hypothetical protein HOU83_gp04 [Sulfolobales Beppu filamentous virus 3]AZI75839.1 hypothetical protein SBFV3_gp04 [Sulfolobales Beppu filamentous virus 3]